MLEAGDAYLDLEIDYLNLMPAKYALSLWATDDSGGVVYDNVEYGATLEVDTANIYNSGKSLDSRCGIVFFPQKWNLSGTQCAAQEAAQQADEYAPRFL